MRPLREFSNIALVGFMGTGKSTVGQLVATMLGFKFLDTDAMIENLTQRRISDLFTNEGEARFRGYEKQIVEHLKSETRCVISTGGGLVAAGDNLESLKEHSLIVCLWCSPEAIFKRVKHQSHRPLLQVDNPLEEIRQLLSKRAPFYRQADVLLSSEFRTPREVAAHVVQNFRAVQGTSAAS
jgi:shikimate kinase